MFFLLQAFAKQFNSTPDDLDMHVIYGKLNMNQMKNLD